MNKLEIQLSGSLRSFLETRAANSGCASVAEYVHALLEEVRQEHEDTALEQELIKGRDSGEAIEIDAAFWERFRARYRRRLAAGA